MRALIVDDSSSMRAILKRTLQERGIEVLTAASGSAALPILAGNQLDLALIDWNMPAMSGFELVQKIRSNPAYQAVKVIMVTTETNQVEMSHALATGADEYVMKPFTPEVIYQKLRLVGLPVQGA